MCAICGCGIDKAAGLADRDADPHAGHAHAHAHADSHAHGHAHSHAHDHSHDHAHTHSSLVAIEARIVAKNDALAQRNRGWFAGREILALNLMSAPGAGKTSLIERTIGDLRDELPLCVIEGDQASANDAERIKKAGAPVVQLNTGTGCHLDAEMVGRGLARLRPSPGAVVIIENVGNLVCPALFDLGEHAKIVIFSITEGEDKPVKYPHMFQAADLVVLSKIDLLPHLDFDRMSALANLRAVNPAAAVLPISARTGEGMGEWYDWLRRQREAARAAVFA
jgi:hydrogenase nickel incorporation protein HypB